MQQTRSQHWSSRRLTQAQRSWLLIAAVALFTVIAQGADWSPWLRYDRTAVSQAEVWRLSSAAFVHLSWPHLALNLAGLVLLGLLFAAPLRTTAFGLSLLLCALGVGLGLHLFSTDVQSYVGLSGALHGLFAVGAFAMLREKRTPRFGLVLLAGLVLKLGWEWFAGARPMSELIGGVVIIEAHSYGAISGCCVAASLYLARRLAPSRQAEGNH